MRNVTLKSWCIYRAILISVCMCMYVHVYVCAEIYAPTYVGSSRINKHIYINLKLAK